ncbi:MAG: DNA polymerase III subunit alpha, partial [Paracoccaceae bacterium]|nr:DNA polymerase III subunit alpha [Paracoccaceae bacterium]
DQLDPNRRRIFSSLDALTAYSAAIFEQRTSNQVSLFGEAGDDLPEPRLSTVDDWLPNERLAEEETAIGFYLSGHPLDDYMPALRRKKLKTIKDLRDMAESGRESIERVGVIVSGLQERKSGRGTRFFRMNISDPTGQVSGMALFPEDFESVRQVFEQTTQVVMTLEARFNEGQFDPIARSVAPIDTVAAAGASAGLNVMIDAVDAGDMIHSVLARYREDGSVKAKGPVRVTVLSVPLEGAPQDIPIDLGDGWPVSPQIKGALKSLPGVVAVEELAS